MRRKTKIVATYGPAVASPEGISRLIEAGADVIRLNFSYGDHAEHAAAIGMIREEADRRGKSVAILQDLRGPKVRVGPLPTDPLELTAGGSVLLTAESRSDSPRTIPVEGYPRLGEDLSPGDAVLLSDGELRLRVDEVGGEGVLCTVEAGGPLRSHNGINFPNTRLRGLRSVTPKDEVDLDFGLRHEVDLVALSFVREAEDIRELRRRIKGTRPGTPIIAKIEKREALENLEEIVREADGIMVARGDLGVETDLAEVALRQKEIIRICNQKGKIVITATQMLESMITHPLPTRAEVSDVSNAILDGTDAVMLSGETAMGSFPTEAVSFMARIAERTECELESERLLARRPFLDEVPDAVAHAACVTAHEIGASALICCTRSGLTARLVSRYRPSCPVLAVSPERRTVRRLAIVWGVLPLYTDYRRVDDGLLVAALNEARTAGPLREGDRVVITAGLSEGILKGLTNLIRVEIVQADG